MYLPFALFLLDYSYSLFNAKFYDTPIGQITQINNTQSTQVSDEHHNKDTKHKETLHIHILNGKFEGKTTTITHEYTESQADSEAFSKMIKSYCTLTKISPPPI